MGNIHHMCMFCMLILLGCIQDQDSPTLAQQIEDIVEVLPGSVHVLLENEPLGLGHTNAFLVLMSSVIALTLFGISLVFKRKAIGGSQQDNGAKLKCLRDGLATKRKVLELKEEELKKIKQNLRQTQEECLHHENKLAEKLKENEENSLSMQILAEEITMLKNLIEEVRRNLQNQLKKYDEMQDEQALLKNKICEMENQLKIQDKEQRNEITERQNQFQRKVEEMGQIRKEKLKNYKKMQDDMAEEKKELERQKSELETKLQKSREDQKYDEMSAKLENMRKEYRNKISAAQATEYTHWSATKHMERRLKGEVTEKAVVRLMLSDLHKKLGRDYRYCHIAHNKSRQVYFNEYREIFVFNGQDPPKAPELPVTSAAAADETAQELCLTQGPASLV